MKNLIVANWKMNPNSQKEAGEIFSAIGGPASGWDKEMVEVIICPPFVYIPILDPKLLTIGPKIGAQNIYFEESGAFTGEVSALMLNDLGVEYVILGHSERRRYFGETNETINLKIKKALEHDLKPIFCIGETEEQRDQGKKSEILEKQIQLGLADISEKDVKNVAIAYEPVWAIGTGNNCSVEETLESVSFIRKIISELYSEESAEDMRILYGGSVKSENSGSYTKEAGANGLLVGGASLNAEEFVKIIKSAE